MLFLCFHKSSPDIRNGKFRIAQALAEGVERQAFHIPVGRGRRRPGIVIDRKLSDMARKGGRQSAGRTAVSINQVCQGFSSHGSRIEGIKHRIGSFFDLFDTVRSSSDQKHHQRFSQFGKLQDQLLLGSRNMAHGTVHPFSAVHGKTAALFGDRAVSIKDCPAETGRGASGRHDDNITSFCQLQCFFPFLLIRRIETGAHGIFHRNAGGRLFFHTGKDRHTGIFWYRRRIVSKHGIPVRRMITDQGDLLITVFQRKDRCCCSPGLIFQENRRFFRKP